MVKIENLIKDYKLDNEHIVHALKGIDLDFENNEFVSILGQSGCGKTTLLNIIGGLDTPTSGQIIFNGLSLGKMNDKEIDAYRNNQIGFVLQNYYLIPNFNILDNVKLGISFNSLTKKEIDDLALEKLKLVGMEEYAKSYPRQLSGGQMQRVAIARALVNDPSIILADEPTGALDVSTAKEIMDLLKELSKDKLVIMVTHNEVLAKEYSTRIIKIHDGLIKEDKTLIKVNTSMKEKENKKVNLSFLSRIKLAFKSLLNKKLKTIMTIIATSFGMVGISFFFGLNHGFNQYANRFSSSIATSTPIIISPYLSNTSIIPSEEYNTTIEYPSSDEIYPLISTKRETTYQYNNFSTKYFNYLDKLKRENLIREYFKLYSPSYSLNLLSMVPENFTSNNKVCSPISTSNKDIFHELYGNLDDYDVIAGEMPKSDTDLVLIVNKYNSISFSYLKALGFYPTSATDTSVINKELETKVKPIKFSDVIGKEYKAYTSDEFYTKNNNIQITDDLGINRNLCYYSNNNYLDLYNDSNIGKTLKISGIIRPKNLSGISGITPSLCYLDSLKQSFVLENEKSLLSKELTSNIVFKYTGDDEAIYSLNGNDKLSTFLNKLDKIKSEYSSSKDKIFPKEDINNLLKDFFVYFDYDINAQTYINNNLTPNKGFSIFLSDALKLGVELVDSSLLGKDLSDEEVLNEQIEKIKSNTNPTSIYNNIISIVSYMNAYSLVSSVYIYPTGVSQRSEILDRLDDFNIITPGSSDHASSESEVVLYNQENKDYRVEQVSVVMSIVYEILAIFVVICLIVASSMIVVITSSNVIERTKEIGLLRSMGASKKDIAILFELETFVCGLISGLFSSILTFILQIPLNYSISKNYPGFYLNTICNFTWYHMIFVLLISISVGLLAAIIPSLKAANKNPVDCLRSD